MKKLLLIIALSGLAILSAAGQSNNSGTPAPGHPSQADQLQLWPDDLPLEKLEMMVRFQATTVSRVLGVNVDMDGVIPRVMRADYPLHLLNPLAPARYGSGVENLSIDPVTRRANGIVFLSIRF